jgi:hypothetical protein
MPPEERIVPRFAAEPPREGLPYGRWAQRLEGELKTAFEEVARERDDLGAPGPVAWFPDRTWHGRTYVPATATTSGGFELFGYVRYVPADGEGGEPSGFTAHADYTEETAAVNSSWTIDLCEETIGRWRGAKGEAAMTLVWGRPLVAGGAVATAELGPTTVDQCDLTDARFTLLAPDDYDGDLLDIVVWNRGGEEIARESLYEGDDED